MSRVQLGSQAVVGKLETRFSEASKAYAARRSWKNPKAKKAFLFHMQQVSREAFQLLRANVSVNGSPWDYTLKDDDTAPRDRELSAQLKAIQLEVYELISRVAKHRAEMPHAVDKELSKCPAMDLPERAMDGGSGNDQDQSAASEATASARVAALLDRLAKTMDEISELSRSLPQRKTELQTLARALEIEKNNLLVPEESDDEGGQPQQPQQQQQQQQQQPSGAKSQERAG